MPKIFYIDCYCSRCMASPERKEYERAKNRRMTELMESLLLNMPTPYSEQQLNIEEK